MRYQVLIILLYIPSVVLGASFDCAKAQLEVEKIICEYPYLSDWDDELDMAYTIAKDNVSEESKKQLIATQRKWLKQVRNACNDDECLTVAYTTRLEEIEAVYPNALKSLTCEIMRKYPQKIFSVENIDLGSGHVSPTEVDYRCPESLATFPFLQKILAIANEIRGETGGECSGSIIHAHWRYYHFSLTKAGFAPMQLVEQADKEQNPNSYPATAYPAVLYRNLFAYFRQWGEQSIYTHQLYKDFFNEFNSSLPRLTAHYKNKFGLTQDEAEAAARHALMLIADWAAGTFSMDILYDSPSLIVDVAREPKSLLADYKKALDGSEKNEANYLYEALSISLLDNRSSAIIGYLLSKMKKEEIARNATDIEPLVSFAINNPENLRLLISNGAPVDAANEFGKTALFYAIGLNLHESAEVLISSGADVNHAYLSEVELRPDGDRCIYPNLKHTKRTPLMHAAQHGDVNMLKLLLKYGARLSEVDEMGSGALEYASMGKRLDNIQFLETLGLKAK